MNAKTWLSRAERIDEEIDELLVARKEMLAKVTKVTQTITGDTVQTTKDPHRFDSVAELDETIFTRVEELGAVKVEILRGINRLKDVRYREVLIGKYVSLETLGQIAVRMHYSWRQVCRIHGRALLKMEEVLNGKDA